MSDVATMVETKCQNGGGNTNNTNGDRPVSASPIHQKPEPKNENGSVSSASCNSILSQDLDVDDDACPNGTKTRVKSGQLVNLQTQRKAKRIRFFRNGDKFFEGVVVPVMPERFRSFDSLITDLTRVLVDQVTLPCGVRFICNLDGKKISTLDELEDGECYVCLGKGEIFKRLEYKKISAPKAIATSAKSNRLSIIPMNVTNTSNTMTGLPRVAFPDANNGVRPRIVTLIRNGIKPRKIIRLLLNKRNASTMEQVLAEVTEAVKLDSGAVRKVFTLAGAPVQTLLDFFKDDDVFFVYGNERVLPDDWELEFEESKAIQQYKKTPVLKHRSGVKPKMPKKAHMKTNRGGGAGGDEGGGHSLLSQLSKDDNIMLPMVLRNKYQVGRTIGDGNFAIVRLCEDKVTHVKYALKIIDKAKCKGKEDMVENEVRILRQVHHEYIIKLFEDADTKPMLYLVMELVPGGDLFDAITRVQTFPEEQAALMLSHLASALAYLHNLNIVHRDVKPENLLVHFQDDRVTLLKLADFGLACEVDGPLYSVCGTPTYVAPEILAETGYGLKIDVWAAGVILYILLCGFPPFINQANDQEMLFDSILSGKYDFPPEYWGGVSSLAKELIDNMLQLSPNVRFSAEDILDHPWFALSGSFFSN